MPQGRKKSLTSSTPRMRPIRVVRLVYKDFPRLNALDVTDKVDARADAILEEVFEYFDIAPVLFGEPLQARLVANDLIIAVKQRIKEEGDSSITIDRVMRRWSDRLADQRRSIDAFQRMLQTRVRSEAP